MRKSIIFAKIIKLPNFYASKTEKDVHSLQIVGGAAFAARGVTLVAVSKTHPAERIREAYDAGQRVFGENRPQELGPRPSACPPT